MSVPRKTSGTMSGDVVVTSWWTDSGPNMAAGCDDIVNAVITSATKRPTSRLFPKRAGKDMH